MRFRVLLLAVVGLLICNLVFAEVPKLVNFQGRLTDSSGKFVTDGDYSLTFRIYSDSTGGVAKWTENQTATVSKGLFNVTLGSDTPIPDSIFNYTNVWLGIQVETDLEMSPRQRLSSLGYSYRTAKADTSSYSMNSDKLDGYDATDFSTTGTDYGRSGVATDLYEGTATLTDKYVNEGQSNSVTSSMITNGQIADADVSASANISPSKISGTAWTSNNDGSGSGMDADLLDGQQASAFLSVSSDYGRLGVTANLYEGATTLTNKYVNEVGPETVNSSSGTAFTSNASGSSNSGMFGIEGYANNTGTGNAFGGYFRTSNSGTGEHYGVFANGYSSSSSPAYGAYGWASNSSSGDAYGGYFETSSDGNGTHYGIRADGFGIGPITYGSYGKAVNTSSGNSYGGYFETSTSGTGTQHYGVVGMGYGSSSAYTTGSFGGAFSSASGSAYGFYGYADNTSNGYAYGGYFSTTYSGTGTHYGMRAEGLSNGLYSYGCYALAKNNSTGQAYGGYFEADSAGTGVHVGVEAKAYGNSSTDDVWGIYTVASNSSSGQAMAGEFNATSASGQSFGIEAIANGTTSGVVNGITGGAFNSGTGMAYGGYLYASWEGSGVHYGVMASSDGNSASSTYGIHSDATNYSSGNVYAGYFAVDSTGSGAEYGVYSQASVQWWAGWFQGDLGVSRNQYVYGNSYVSGTKSAAVKIENGEYRALYSQESPESWFEDFGEGQLINGQAHIELDPLFLQTVAIDDLHPMKVFVQLEGDCNGVFVTKELTGFNVTELRGGTSSVPFSYRVVAKRKGYEDIRMAKIMSKTPEDIALEKAKHQAGVEKEKASIKEERIKIEQQRQEIGKEQERIKTENVLPTTEIKK